MLKMFFYWTTRDSSSFRIFRRVMEDLYNRDTQECLEIRHFLTTGEPPCDLEVGTMLLDAAANKIHSSTELDIRLGHHSRETLAIGRPDWETEFDHIAENARTLDASKVGVFLCGPETMARQVSSICTAVSKKRKEQIVFAKESF